MTPREPDRYEEKALELCPIYQPHSAGTPCRECERIAAALRAEREETLREVQRKGSTEWIAAELYRAALASPAAAPAWMPPRDAMTGMTADEEMRAAGIDVLRGVRPAAAPAAEPSAPAAPAPLQMDEDWCCVVCGRGLEPCYACGPVPAQGAEARIQELEELVAEANRQLAALAARTSSPPGAGERK